MFSLHISQPPSLPFLFRSFVLSLLFISYPQLLCPHSFLFISFRSCLAFSFPSLTVPASSFHFLTLPSFKHLITYSHLFLFPSLTFKAFFNSIFDISVFHITLYHISFFLQFPLFLHISRLFLNFQQRHSLFKAFFYFPLSISHFDIFSFFVHSLP